MHPALLKFGMNLWPPFLGAGIKVGHIAANYQSVSVSLKMGLLNKNIAGVHFGGSLFAMVDPFFMIMVQQNLGKDYIVWDRAARIDFIKPGKGRVSARFAITEEQLEAIKAAAANGEKVLKDFTVEVRNQLDEVVASVVKTLYIRKKLSDTKSARENSFASSA